MRTHGANFVRWGTHGFFIPGRKIRVPVRIVHLRLRCNFAPNASSLLVLWWALGPRPYLIFLALAAFGIVSS